MDIIERLYTAVEASPDLGDFSGTILIKQANKEIYTKTAGFADCANQIPNTMQTRFATASVTKMFTAVAIFQLIQEKKIDLNLKVVDYLALENTRIDPNIMLTHLLSHTSGLGNYFNDDEADAYEKVWQEIPNCTVDDLKKILDLFIDNPPVFKPGEKFQYCDAGYILLGMVIEKASGISYFDWVRQNIFKRAGMDDSDFLSLDHINPGAAEGYIPSHDASGNTVSWRKNIYAVPILGASDGGAFTTAEDAWKFMYALRAHKLINKNLTEQMLLPRVSDTEEWKYGYGVWLETDKKQKIIRYGHSGEDPGVSCRVYHYPAFDTDVIVLGNRSLCAGPVMASINRAITAADQL